MTKGNQSDNTILSQMLKEHKKIRIMTYIADNQSFTPSHCKYCAKPGYLGSEFAEFKNYQNQDLRSQPQSTLRDAKSFHSQVRGGVCLFLFGSEFSEFQNYQNQGAYLPTPQNFSG